MRMRDAVLRTVNGYTFRMKATWIGNRASQKEDVRDVVQADLGEPRQEMRDVLNVPTSLCGMIIGRGMKSCVWY